MDQNPIKSTFFHGSNPHFLEKMPKAPRKSSWNSRSSEAGSSFAVQTGPWAEVVTKDLVEFKNFGWAKNSHLSCTYKIVCIYIYNIHIQIWLYTSTVYIYIYDNVTQPNLWGSSYCSRLESIFHRLISLKTETHRAPFEKFRFYRSIQGYGSKSWIQLGMVNTQNCKFSGFMGTLFLNHGLLCVFLPLALSGGLTGTVNFYWDQFWYFVIFHWIWMLYTVYIYIHIYIYVLYIYIYIIIYIYLKMGDPQVTIRFNTNMV